MEMRGTVRSWDEGKGFGFIQPESGGRDVFAHASSLIGRRRLAVGEVVLYSTGRDQQGRLCATYVRAEGEMVLNPARAAQAPARERRPATAIQRPGLKLALLAALLVLPLWGSLTVLGERHSLLPLAAYLGVSLLAFLLYWQDKSRAVGPRGRPPEQVLHLAERAGGWPGALVAQQLLRHKTRKLSFQLVCWASVALHQVLWIDYLFLRAVLRPYL